MTDVDVKICGIRNAKTAIAATQAGASYLGFVFFRKSPRFVRVETAEEIILELKQSSFELGFEMPKLVGLFVDAGEKELAETAPFLTHFQFHGHESPERCEEMGREFAVDVIKAIAVSADAAKDDFDQASEFSDAADLILFDAKPPPGAGRPGGNGLSFDWSVLEKYTADTPYLLAGGLTPENVVDAVATSAKNPAFTGVDVSSGVETAPGVKSDALINAFIKTVS